MERLDSPLGKPAIVRTRHGPDGVLEEAQGFEEGGVVRGEDDGAHDDVRVAVDVFGETVHDDVSSEEERGGIEGREEGVVDEDQGGGGV